jgi:hypothetical protein
LCGGRLTIRIARGPERDPESAKRMILETPGIIEEELQVLDGHLRAGTGNLIDLLAVDVRGALALIEFDRNGEEELFHRVLDHHAWVAGQALFLRRLYGGGRIDPFRTPRLFVLSPRFSGGFLKKLSYLKIPVEPRVYRLLVAGDEPALYVERAETWSAEADLPAVADDGASLPAAPERLSPEELEAFYDFERKLLENDGKARA